MAFLSCDLIGITFLGTCGCLLFFIFDLTEVLKLVKSLKDRELARKLRRWSIGHLLYQLVHFGHKLIVSILSELVVQLEILKGQV